MNVSVVFHWKDIENVFKPFQILYVVIIGFSPQSVNIIGFLHNIPTLESGIDVAPGKCK